MIIVSYVTVAEIRSYTGLTSSQVSDALVEDFISAAEEYIDSYCGTTFTSTSAEDLIDGDDSSIIIVNNQPIISVSSLEYSLNEGDSYSTLSSDFYFTKEWCVKLKQKSPVSGFGILWKVTYNYGHAAVPDAVKNATLSLAGMYSLGYVFDKSSTMDSLKLGDATIYKKDYTKQKAGTIDYVQTILAPYLYTEVMLVR